MRFNAAGTIRLAVPGSKTTLPPFLMQRQVVTFHYILRNEGGEVVDTSNREQPVTYLEGSGSIIDGLEKALRSMRPGDHRKVALAPEQGYGLRDESQVQLVERSALPVQEIKIGDMFQAGEDRHSPVVRVVAMDQGKVTLDANHPLAGTRLYFEVEVVSKREASAEELAHGHVHGPGGHHHH